MRLDIHVEPNLQIAGDHDELARVTENLIENAIKYGVWGKDSEIDRVEVSLIHDGTEARLAVRDFGPGIEADHLPRLTERFYRVDDGLSRAKGGTGLGLAIVKHIVARHRGRMNIESQINHGSVFSASFPLASS